jgi:hypothetical protein
MWRFAASLPTSIRIPSTLAEFRKRHLQALAGSFTQALQLCAVAIKEAVAWQVQQAMLKNNFVKV